MTDFAKPAEAIPNPDLQLLTSTLKRKSADREGETAISPSQHPPEEKTHRWEEDKDTEMEDCEQSAGSPNAEKETATPILTPSPKQNKNTQKPLRSALRHQASYAKTAEKGKDLEQPPMLPHWVAHRFSVTFETKKPETRHKRTSYFS